MRIDHRSVRAGWSRAHALAVLSLCVGFVATSMPCAVFCGETAESQHVAGAAESTHCGSTVPAQPDSPYTSPVDCCDDDCDACGIDRLPIRAQVLVDQIAMSDHGATLASREWRVGPNSYSVRSRARSPVDTHPYLLDVLSRTTTLLI